MANLTQARVRELFNYDADTGVLTWRIRPLSDFASDPACRSWNTRYAGKPAGTFNETTNCIVMAIGGVSYRAHRVAWLWYYGEWPSDQIDHIDGDGSNNRIANMRDVSCSENHRNMPVPRGSRSGVIGVRLHPDGAWVAEIKAGDRYVHLGSFKTVAEAAIARKAAEKVLGYHANHGRSPAPRRRA